MKSDVVIVQYIGSKIHKKAILSHSEFGPNKHENFPCNPTETNTIPKIDKII